MHNVLRQSNLQATFQVRQSSTTIRKNRGVWGGNNTTSEYYDNQNQNFNKTTQEANLKSQQANELKKKLFDTEEEDNKQKKLEEYEQIVSSLKKTMDEKTFDGI